MMYMYVHGQVQAIWIVTYGTFRDFKQEITMDEIIYMAIFLYESVAIIGQFICGKFQFRPILKLIFNAINVLRDVRDQRISDFFKNKFIVKVL